MCFPPSLGLARVASRAGRYLRFFLAKETPRSATRIRTKPTIAQLALHFSVPSADDFKWTLGKLKVKTPSVSPVMISNLFDYGN